MHWVFIAMMSLASCSSIIDDDIVSSTLAVRLEVSSLPVCFLDMLPSASILPLIVPSLF